MRRTRRRRGTALGIRERERREVVPCEVCERPLEDGRLYELRGRSDGTFVVLRGVPCLLCPTDRHPRKLRTNDFPAKLSEAVLEGEALPLARTRRFRGLACHACRRKLGDGTLPPDPVSGDVTVDGAGFRVEISAPRIRCGRCGAVQVKADSRVCLQIGEALTAALERGGLRP